MDILLVTVRYDDFRSIYIDFVMVFFFLSIEKWTGIARGKYAVVPLTVRVHICKEIQKYMYRLLISFKEAGWSTD